MKRLKICVLFILLHSLAIHAQELSPSVSLDAETRFFERLAESEDGQNEKGQSEALGILEEVPDAVGKKDLSPECDPRSFEDSVLENNLPLTEYFARVQSYFKKCQGELISRSLLGRLGLLQFSKYQYPFFSHPQVSEFLVKLPNGTKVPGILALKKDPRPRPLVILKCGVFCSAWPTSTLKSYLMHLFDQSPFNVLMLANQTGMDYIYYNKRLAIGGFTEGYEVLQVGQWMLENWEHKDRISSLHLMGISLGGNAAVMGGVYNDLYPLPSGRKVFNSVTAICPVVTLKPTLLNLYSSQIAGRALQKTSKEHFLEAKDFITDVPDLISEAKFPSHRTGYPDFIGNLVVTSLNRRGVALDRDGFFKSNNFFNVTTPVKTPILFWASKDDSVVSTRLNTEVVEHHDVYEKMPNVGVLNLSHGDHCGFSSAYGFQASAAVLRTFVLQNSPEFAPSYKPKHSQPWAFGFSKLGPQHEHIGQSWKFFAGQDKAKISFRVFDWSRGEQCFQQGPWDAPPQCVFTRSFWVPVAALKDLGARVPKNDVEAQAITREFNTKVEFRTKGQPLNGTNSRQFDITWRKYFE